MDKINKNKNISELLKIIFDNHRLHFTDTCKYLMKNIEFYNVKPINIFLKENSINQCDSRYIISSLEKSDFLSKNLLKNIQELDKKHIKYHKAAMKILKKITNKKIITEEEFEDFVIERDNLEEIIFNSIIEAESYEKKFDGLTGFFNKKYFKEEALKYLEKDQNTFLIMSDIDYFKKVNDNYGHAVGDFILKELSKIFKESLRGNDLLGRFGGEEFIFLISAENEITAKKVFERIRQKIEEKKFNYNGIEIKLTVSFGITKKQIFSDLDSLIKKADSALYKSKDNGRNRITIL
jgi:diguanylate cyclase (GGDEF)-like protein